MKRAVVLANHIQGRPDHETLRRDGWGFEDSRFVVGPDGHIRITGRRYPLSGETLDKLRPWMEEKAFKYASCQFICPDHCFCQVGLDMAQTSPSAWTAEAQESMLQPAIRNEGFISLILEEGIKCAWDADARIFHAHGHTCREIFTLRSGKSPPRVPDVVIWPQSHEEVEKLVQSACDHDVCIVPYGGGTSVTGALQIPETESRMVVSLDMHDMCKVLSIDKSSLMVTVEAGITGVHLERVLKSQGLNLGHEPDSYEFSSLGGWVATRASGMKKNVYGNIEAMVRGLKV